MKNRKGAKKDRTHIKVILILTNRHGVVSTYHSGTKSRFMLKLKAKNWVKCHIKVLYGKQKDVFGKLIEFTNEGVYENSHDAIQAFNAFLE